MADELTQVCVSDAGSESAFSLDVVAHCATQFDQLFFLALCERLRRRLKEPGVAAFRLRTGRSRANVNSARWPIANWAETFLVRFRCFLRRVPLFSFWNHSRHIYDYRALARFGEGIVFSCNGVSPNVDLTSQVPRSQPTLRVL